MSATPLIKHQSSSTFSLYEATGLDFPSTKKYIVSTPETRAICNDPFVVGIKYTSLLKKACERALSGMQEKNLTSLKEQNTTVLHILRGGLNFGLREALADAFKWNSHTSAFISAQRARKAENPQDWVITESAYQKLSFHGKTSIVFGDVVATGTSLEHGLRKIGETAQISGSEITDVIFFTIGSPRSHEILGRLEKDYKSRFPSYQNSVVVYFEGIFAAATTESPLRIKIDGTDLLRTQSLLAPEFIESQYESPSYPLERCTIYDAGSRAFELGEYYEDLHDYWTQTLTLAKQGVSFKELLQERFPELDSGRFSKQDLVELCMTQLKKIPSTSS